MIPQRGEIGGGGIGGTTDEPGSASFAGDTAAHRARGELIPQRERGEISGGGIGGTTDVGAGEAGIGGAGAGAGAGSAGVGRGRELGKSKDKDVISSSDAAFDILGVGMGGRDEGGPELRGAHKVRPALRPLGER